MRMYIYMRQAFRAAGDGSPVERQKYVLVCKNLLGSGPPR